MKKLLILCLALAGTNTTLSSQDTTGIPSESVEVIKNYEAAIAQASRKDIVIEARKQDLPTINYQYDLSSPKPIDFNRPDPVIRAKALDIEYEREDIKDGSVYGAYGNYRTIKAGAAYHYYIEDWVEAGLSIDHFSARDGEAPHQKFSRTKGELYAGYYFNPDTKIRGTIYGDFVKHFTKIPSVTSDTIDPTTQAFDHTGIRFDFSHTSFEKIGLSLRSSIGFQKINHTQDGTDENNLTGSINVYKKFGSKVAIELPFQFKRIKTRTEFEFTPGFDQNELSFQPRIDVKTQSILAKIGADYVNGLESTLFPHIDIQLNKIAGNWSLGAKVTQDISRVSVFSVLDDNPYTKTFFNDNSYNLYQLRKQFQLNASAVKGMHFLKASVNYHILNNERQYIFDSFSGRYSQELIDRKEWVFTGMYRIKPDDHFAISLDASYIHFADEFAAAYMPKWTGSLKFDKSFGSKLDISLKTLLIGNRSFINGNESFEIPVTPDLAATIKFRASSSISLFVESSNLLAAENYHLWYDHAVLERQFWGGAQINF